MAMWWSTSMYLLKEKETLHIKVNTSLRIDQFILQPGPRGDTAVYLKEGNTELCCGTLSDRVQHVRLQLHFVAGVRLRIRTEGAGTVAVFLAERGVPKSTVRII